MEFYQDTTVGNIRISRYLWTTLVVNVKTREVLLKNEFDTFEESLEEYEMLIQILNTVNYVHDNPDFDPETDDLPTFE